MPELLFKTATVDQHTFSLHVEDTETIAEIKQKIEDKYGHNMDEQVMFFNGRELDDTMTVAQLGNIQPPDFIIIFMVDVMDDFEQPEWAEPQQNQMEMAAAILDQAFRPAIHVAMQQLTAQDHQALDRLRTLGFPLDLVIEAYIVSDRNEEHAVEYILARMVERNAERH